MMRPSDTLRALSRYTYLATLVSVVAAAPLPVPYLQRDEPV